MSVSERIYEEVKRLPEPLQAEVLDFVQHLTSKEELDIAAENEFALAELSLSLAMCGMEDEDTPSHSDEDLREVF